MGGVAEESTRADWLLSHVYTVLGQSTPAVHYPRHCLATCEREGFGDFDLAYTYEAMAHGNRGRGTRWAAALEWRAKAQEQQPRSRIPRIGRSSWETSPRSPGTDAVRG